MDSGDLTRGIERGGLATQHHLSDVPLWEERKEPQETGGTTHPEHQHAGGIGVERPRMADLAGSQHPPGLGHNVVAGPPGRLVDQQQPALLKCLVVDDRHAVTYRFMRDKK